MNRDYIAKIPKRNIKGVLIQPSYILAMWNKPMETKIDFLFAIIYYVNTGIKPKMNREVSALFEGAKCNIDSAKARYEKNTAKEKCEQNEEAKEISTKNTKKRIKKSTKTIKNKSVTLLGQTQEKTSEKSNESKSEYNDNEKENKNDNQNENNNECIMGDTHTLKNKFIQFINSEYPDKWIETDFPALDYDLLINAIKKSDFIRKCKTCDTNWLIVNYEEIVKGKYDDYIRTPSATHIPQPTDEVDFSTHHYTKEEINEIAEQRDPILHPENFPEFNIF